MNRLLTRFAIFALIACFSSKAVADDDKQEKAEPGKQVAQSLKMKIGEGDSAKEKTVNYWLYLPKDYAEKKNSPLMLFLHGAGERGDDLKQVKKWGPPKLVDGGKDMPFVVVSPQCPRRTYWKVEQMVRLVDHLAGELKIDKSRMYITGLSMGGFGTWSIIAKHPKLFAAAAPICGGGNPETAEKIKNIPIWAFHGDADRVVPASRSQKIVDAIKKIGGEKVKLTLYPGVNHNSWSQTYANPKLYEWLLSHKRGE